MTPHSDPKSPFIVVLVVADMLGAIAFISTDAGASPLTLRAATLLEVSP